MERKRKDGVMVGKLTIEDIEKRIFKSQSFIEGKFYNTLEFKDKNNSTIVKVDIKTIELQDVTCKIFEVIELTTHPSVYFKSYRNAYNYSLKLMVEKLIEIK